MKNSIWMVAVGGLLAAGLASCGGNGSQEEFFSFQSYSMTSNARSADVDSIGRDSIGSDDLWEVKTSGVMPVKIGSHQLTALNDTLGALACINLSANPAVIQLPAELQPLSGAAEDSVAPKSKLVKKLTVETLTPKLAVFRVYTYSYPSGAAHGLYSNRYINYDVEGGNLVELSGLFNPGYERTLQPMIVSKLKATKSQLLAEDSEITVSPNFRITEDGLEFVYGLYSVAPYSDGEPIVSFTPYELSGLLSAEGKQLLGVID